MVGTANNLGALAPATRRAVVKSRRRMVVMDFGYHTFVGLVGMLSRAALSVPSAYAEVILKRGGRTMPALDWSECPAVESIPGKVSGAWVFRDTRMPVSIVFENLESGASIEEIMEWLDVTREQIQAVLEFAARSLDVPPPARTTPPVNAHSL